MFGSFQPCLGTMRCWIRSISQPPLDARALAEQSLSVHSPSWILPLGATPAQLPTASIYISLLDAEPTDGGQGPLCLCKWQVRSTGELIHPWGGEDSTSDWLEGCVNTPAPPLLRWGKSRVHVLPWGQHTSHAKGQMVNISSFVGHTVSHSYSTLLL